jgi:curved DNA-binding protein
MDYKDYYKILGVSPEADDKTIKKAYRELAKKYHPDQNQNDKSAEEKFKEISEAYQAVADPAKRQKYDTLRQDYEQWQRFGSHSSFDWSAWQTPGSSTYRRPMSEEDFSQFFDMSGMEDDVGFGGLGGFSDFFSMLFGNGKGNSQRSEGAGGNGFFRRASQAAQANKAVKGKDLQGEFIITLEQAYRGETQRVRVNEKVLEAKIPRGVKHGSRIRLAGQGSQGSNGGRQGDLLLKVLIEDHAIFQRDGDHLRMTAEIDFYTAVLGGEFPITRLIGQNDSDSQILLKIPPQTQNGQVFRLKGKGMPLRSKASQYGDLYVKAEIVLPSDLKEDEIKGISTLAEEFRPRKSKES